MTDQTKDRERRERLRRWLPRMKAFVGGVCDGASGAPWAFVNDCADLIEALDEALRSRDEARALRDNTHALASVSNANHGACIELVEQQEAELQHHRETLRDILAALDTGAPCTVTEFALRDREPWLFDDPGESE